MSRNREVESHVTELAAETQEILAAVKARAPRGSIPKKTWTKEKAAATIAAILSTLSPEDRSAVLAFVQ
jgi:hypothetical protein